MKKLLKRFLNWVLDNEKKPSHEYPQIQEMVNNGLNDNYLFDFLNWGQAGGNGIPMNNFLGIQGSSGEANSPPQKIKIKPIDVLNELETIPTPFTILGLDDKILVLRDKEKIIQQHYAKREMTFLIERLENRKKYQEHKAFFDQFQNTTDEKIEVLLEKYDLVKRSSDIFIPEFPEEAIRRMKEYNAKVEEVCGKQSVFYVIATSDSFKKSYQKRDPILLVQSPFGFFWQILGAWDKEMLLLSEL